MQIDNKKIDTLIVKSFCGTLSTEENDTIQAWLNLSKENKSYYAQLKNIWDVTYPAFDPMSIDINKAEKTLLKRIKHETFTFHSFINLWQKVAAILLIPLSILLAYLVLSPVKEQAITYQEVISPFGTTSKITLPDGTIAWLNSGSKLKFPTKFNQEKREISLAGEAFFHVESDKQHPFIVHAQNMAIEATGTQFNVEAYNNDTIVAVTLIEGKVNVEINGHGSQNLKPDERIVFNSLSKNIDVTTTNAAYWSTWKDGILTFRDETLENVFKRISRTYNVNIQVKDPVIAKQLYRATFEDESLDEILHLLQVSAPIKYKKIGRLKQNGNNYSKDLIEVYKLN